MPRYIALLRGVSPRDTKMPELKLAFESAGFTNVRTVLSSGNVVFDSPKAKIANLEQKAEAAIMATLGRSFYTIVRSQEDINNLLVADAFAAFTLPVNAKRVVSFMRVACAPKVKLPHSADEAHVLTTIGTEAYTAYVANEAGPVFMKLIEQAFGKEVTTRTWETLQKCAKA
jgi:uncharacterized protein (DUF1697 family)